MSDDLAGAAFGLLLGPLVFVAPGYAVGWATDALGFRARRAAGRLACALVLSVALVPVFLFFAVRLGGWEAALAAGALVWIAALVSLVRDRPNPRGLGRPAGIALVVAVVLVVLVVDVGWGDRLYFSVVARDYLKHIAVTHALQSGGVPPPNVYFQPGPGPEAVGPLFYYYGWFLACAALDALGGVLVGSRAAVFAGTAFSGLALAATAALWSGRAPNPLVPDAAGRDRRLLAAALLLVGGLDLVAFLGGAAGMAALGRPVVFTDLDWWNEPVFLWITSVLTVPHHVGALVAALAGCALVRDGAEARGRARAVAVVLGGAAFASAALCSIWVAMTVAGAIAAWVGFALVRRWNREAGAWAAAGVVAGILALPFALDLRAAGETAGVPVALWVRPFKPLELLGVPFEGTGALAHLLVLPLHYALEFGAMAALGALFWFWRRRVDRPLSREEAFRLVVFVASLLFVTFVRSAVRSNDLGFRGVMLAQFMVLLWGADALDALRRGAVRLPRWMPRPALGALLALGLAATGANALVLRLVPLAADAGWIAMPGMYAPEPGELGHRTADQRAAYEWLNIHLSPDARTQHHPHPGVERNEGGFAFAPFLYGEHPVAVADDDLGTLFGISEARYAPHARRLARIFDGAVDYPATVALARQYGIAALVVTDLDPVWRDRAGWVWTHPPAFARDHVRVFLIEGR